MKTRKPTPLTKFDSYPLVVNAEEAGFQMTYNTGMKLVFERQLFHGGGRSIASRDKLSKTFFKLVKPFIASTKEAPFDLNKKLDADTVLPQSGLSSQQFLYEVKNSTGMVYINYVGDDTPRINCYFDNPQERDQFINKMGALITRKAVKTDAVSISFWHMSQHGPIETSKVMRVPEWAEIRDNYNTVATEELDAIAKMTTTDSASGKLILWSGPPGCGKTYAIRAIARQWQNWCTFNYIIDVEKFFNQADYLIHLLTRFGTVNDGFSDGAPSLNEEETDGLVRHNKWNLLILEDAGELIAHDAKQQTGQALSKLLNITDGLLGQGSNVLILITTNEPLEALNEAVVRHGRCLTNLVFARLSVTEANAWLAAHKHPDLTVTRDTSLSDLYGLIYNKRGRDGTNKITKTKIGFSAA